MQITDKTGGVFSIKAVSEDSDLMITTRDGIVIRMAVSDIRVMGRATQGVRLIKLDKHDEMADIAVIHKSEDEDEPTMLPASDEEE
jgi:DNA gyrase subunit A